nr:Tim44-like domain-containing protein [Vibrio sp. Of7-15]
MFLSMAFIAEPVLAGPGGQIASAIFDSTWGKVLLVVLFILFLPLIVMNSIKTKIAEKRASKDLAFMAVHSDHFDWFKLQQRVKSCFLRVHQGWQGGDLTDTSEWMTEWYWTNQQQVFLDKWKEQGLVNICDVQSVGSIRPLMLVHRNHDDGHRDSSVVVIVSAKMNDYLKDIKTGEIVEGSEEYKTVRTVWSFTLDNDEWKVSGIEQSNTIMQYIKMLDNLPPIQSTLTR